MTDNKRRDFFKLLALSAGASALAEASSNENKPAIKEQSQLMQKNKNKTRVVVVGGGLGGITVAQSIKAHDPSDKIEVVVLEKNSHYFACPMSNTLFGEIKEIEEKKISFLFDYITAQRNHNLEIIITEVIDADIDKKTITTTSGTLDYDYVVVAPGIDYNYKKLFPKWSNQKIRRAKKETPAAMHSDSGKEKGILLAQLKDWGKSGGEGYFVIVPTQSGKVRCKPAPYERACMVSEFIKKYKLPGKVYILDNAPVPQSKGAAFIDIFINDHADTIIFNGMDASEMKRRIKNSGLTMKNFKDKKNFTLIEDTFATANINDVDFDKKEIYFGYSDNFDDEDTPKKITYAIANIIPHHRGNKTAELFNVEKNSWGAIVCAPNKIYSKTDSSVYAAGDIIGYHKLDPSAQTAISVGTLTGESIANRIFGKSHDIDFKKVGITCFSMVKAEPSKVIEIAKDIIVTKEGLAKAGSTTFSIGTGDYLIGWYQSMIEPPYKY